MVKKKKPKETFQEFRNTEKSAYKTFKIPLKNILLNRDTIQPLINNLIFEKSVEIKATNNLSVCDSWIISTAISTNSILVHKDPEFMQVKKKVKLKTLPYKE